MPGKQRRSLGAGDPGKQIGCLFAQCATPGGPPKA